MCTQHQCHTYHQNKFFPLQKIGATFTKDLLKNPTTDGNTIIHTKRLKKKDVKDAPSSRQKTWTNGQPIVNQQFLKKLYSSSIQTRYLLPISTKLSDSPPGSTKTLLRLSTNMPLKVIIVLMSKSKQFLKSPAFHKEEKRGKNNLHGV